MWALFAALFVGSSSPVDTIFKRRIPPALEICASSLEESGGTSPFHLQVSTINNALALTEQAGARWSGVYITTCMAPLMPDTVRLMMAVFPEPGALAVTVWDIDERGYAKFAVISVSPVAAADDDLVLAHELLHAQGLKHICTLPDARRMRGDPPYCQIEHTGHVLFPARNWSGAGIWGVEEALEKVYD